MSRSTSTKGTPPKGTPRTERATQHASSSGSVSFFWIWLAYGAALAAAAVTLLQPWVPVGDSILVRALIADIVATLVIFGFSSAFRNASFYDAYWSVAPPVLASYFCLSQSAPLDLRTLLILTLVLAWAVRLTHNWARGWQGLHHEDWRYVDLQATTGRAWWLVNLLGIHLFPTVLVFLGCISLQQSLAHNTLPFGLFDVVASFIGWAALWLEFTADNRLRHFRSQDANAGKILDSGVWSWCRHPNYLGEIGFWIALFVYAYAAVGSAAVTPAFGAIWGPVAMIALFMGISIPMIDKRLSTRHGYEEHRQTTFALLPINHLRKK